MRKEHLLILCILLTGTCIGQQQPTEAEWQLQQMQFRKVHLDQQLDSGVYFMDMGQYDKADERFRYVLEQSERIPSKLAFFFGKNSYFMGNDRQSIDWLSKYIQLKGTGGQFYEEAVSWKIKSETRLLDQRKKEANKAEEILSSDYEIDCGPSGNVICPVCLGEHVIIKATNFGKTYKTCPFCNEHGILSCEDYNLLIRGELKPK